MELARALRPLWPSELWNLRAETLFAGGERSEGVGLPQMLRSLLAGACSSRLYRLSPNGL